MRGLAVTGRVGTIGSELLVDEISAQSTNSSESGWELKDPPLDTLWTDEVGPDNAHPEYPRPSWPAKTGRTLTAPASSPRPQRENPRPSAGTSMSGF